MEAGWPGWAKTEAAKGLAWQKTEAAEGLIVGLNSYSMKYKYQGLGASCHVLPRATSLALPGTPRNYQAPSSLRLPVLLQVIALPPDVMGRPSRV
jgi:hypothetical protein